MSFSSNSNRNSNSGNHAAPHSTNAAQQRSRQQTATQQIIAENVKHLIEQLEQGKSEALTAYLNAMARFHSYSFGNILSIAHHRPDATHVAGIRTWNEFGRYVKKGQKGIPILAPMIGARRQRDEEAAEQSDKPAPVLIGLRDDGGQPQKNCDRRARQCPTLLRVLKESPYKSPYSLVRVGGREEGGHCS